MATPPGAADDSMEMTSEPQSPVSSDEEMSPSDNPTHQSSTASRPPSLKSTNETQFSSSMSTNSTHIGLVNNARRPTPAISHSSLRIGHGSSGGSLPESMEAKMRAFHLSRQGAPVRSQIGMSLSSGSSSSNVNVPSFGNSAMGLNFSGARRPSAQNIASAPIISKMPIKGGLSARRGMQLPGGLPGSPSNPTANALNLSESSAQAQGQQSGSMFKNFSEYVDTKNGTLRFAGKAIIHGHGIDFTSGSNFSISLDEVDTLEELGKGNYGTVYKVRHARPRIRRPGLGLAGNKLPSHSPITPSSESDSSPSEFSPNTRGSTGIIMAMKEIRLELDEAKFAAIIMELDILHRCVSPYIIDFYGAFFQEGAVYICIEFMDGGSIDKLYGSGVPENVLRKITYATVQGLKTLKDDHNIIHRDVKPTNILVNTLGQVKICDFGVSGNLVASIARTNIGCQSYMAPERISGCGSAQSGTGGGTYSVQSDIWSMGLSIIECALGRYPYPPETYNNIFSQLSAIVDGEPPSLPKDSFTPTACDFVSRCLNKKPKLRPTYSMLLQHEWLAELFQPTPISTNEKSDTTFEHEEPNIHNNGVKDREVAEWVINALERKKNGNLNRDLKPALHAAPLNSGPPSVISPG